MGRPLHRRSFNSCWTDCTPATTRCDSWSSTASSALRAGPQDVPPPVGPAKARRNRRRAPEGPGPAPPCLATVRPPDVRAFAGLAARQIRWVLHDLASQAAAARHITYANDLAAGENPEQDEPVAPVGEPSDVAEWGEFHKRIESLPDEEREMFDLLLYQGLSQPEAAEVLKTSLRTVKRCWQRARLMLRDAMRGEWPSLEDDGR